MDKGEKIYFQDMDWEEVIHADLAPGWSHFSSGFVLFQLMEIAG